MTYKNSWRSCQIKRMLKATIKQSLRKVKITVAKKSIKYLRNTSDALQKLMKKYPSIKPERLLPQKLKCKQ